MPLLVPEVYLFALLTSITTTFQITATTNSSPQALYPSATGNLLSDFGRAACESPSATGASYALGSTVCPADDARREVLPRPLPAV